MGTDSTVLQHPFFSEMVGKRQGRLPGHKQLKRTGIPFGMQHSWVKSTLCLRWT